MMAQARPSFALRPYLPDDAEMLAEIFRASIEHLTGDDYTEAQQDAWASSADEEDFGEKIADGLTLIATLDGAPVAFATLTGNTVIDMLYVHPSVAGQGAGTVLADALERLAQARGATTLTTEASDTAQPFFEKRGYVAQQRNSVMRGAEWLSNTTMTKQLNAGKPS